LSTSLACWG